MRSRTPWCATACRPRPSAWSARASPSRWRRPATACARRRTVGSRSGSWRNSSCRRRATARRAGSRKAARSPFAQSCRCDHHMQPIRVLFVEDDPDYREALAGELSDHGFAVRSFPDSEALLGSLDATADGDVIVLDWVLPEISGLDLMSRLRRIGVTLPVVFLTGYATVANENQAFAQGASDFIDKARGVEIVARRLKLVAETDIARPHPPADERLTCGKLVLDPPNGRASWDGVDVNLTVTEYSVVDLLVSNVGCYLTYRAIYDRMRYEGFVGGLGDEGYRTNVRSCIKRVRRKFCKIDPAFAEIQTSPSFGYRWRGMTAGIGHDVK